MTERRAPHNTQREAQESPMIPLEEVMIFGTSQSIERQEAQGQHSFMTSDTLPTEMRGRPDDDARAVLEASMVRFIGPVDDDPLFQYVELPVGWTKVPTDDARWSKLLDQHGRERATIFYKAAHYDRKASLNLSCRYCVQFDYERFDQDGIGCAYILDGNTRIHQVETVVDGRERYVVSEARQLAYAWLDEHYPDWQNPAAYWE